jgi:glycosyltransferase involved in cell wall biosynthesis
MRVSIIIPTLNEEKNLGYVLPRIPKVPEIVEFILADAHSSDNTIPIAKALLPEIKAVFQDGKGKGNAILCAAKAATGDYFLILDGDGSQRPEEIPLYIEKAKEGYDLVKGGRFMPGGGTEDGTLFRKIIVRTANTVANVVWRTRFSDICYGMFLINRQKYLNLAIESTGFNIEWELMIKAKRKGLRIVEIPSRERKRIYGKTNIHYLRDGSMIARTVFKHAFKRRE